MMNNELVLIILLIVLNKKADKKSLKSSQNKSSLDNNTNIPYTMEKISVMKKIGPYFPEDYHPIINKSIILAEKIIRTYGVIDFIQKQETNYIEQGITVKDNKERFAYISNVIHKEINRGNLKDMGILMESILNIEKYKNISSILIPILSDPQALDDPDKIFNLMEVFMEGKTEKEKEKIKEMAKILEIMKTLDSPKKDSSS